VNKNDLFLKLNNKFEIGFWIKPNFTVEVLSSTNFQVHFHSPSLLCHGNLTKDSLNQVSR
jgi:hypothetical protein